MKKVLIFMGLVVFAGSLSAENFVFNPSFDMTPWDTGWTVEGGGYYYEVYPESSKYISEPHSCYLCGCGGHSQTYFCGSAEVYQKTMPVINCTCRVYLQYLFEGCGIGVVAVEVEINNNWEREWMKGNPDSDSSNIWIFWEKVYTQSDTVRGIRFSGCGCRGPMNGCVMCGILLVDDVYISGEEVGIEEEDNEIANYRLQAYPNPFMKSIEFRVENSELKDSRLEILDVCGRVVRKLPIINNQLAISNVKWNGKDEDGKALPGGIYFAKLSGREENSTLKLILMR